MPARQANLVLSLWSPGTPGRPEGLNLAVISTTSKKVADDLTRWAREQGYRVRGAESEES